jgi:hypothetical protein
MKQYAKRKIDVTINLGNGTFGEDKGEDVTLSGHRTSVSLVLAGGAYQSSAQMRIFGLPMAMINQLTRVGTIESQVRVNKLQIAAGDEDGVMSVVHQGTIRMAYADFNSAPEVAFEVISQAGYLEAIRPVGARSYLGPTDAATVMKDIADSIGASFVSNNVSVILQYPYFPGTAWTQIEACARAANLDFSFDRGVLSIWKRGASQITNNVARIAPDTGMVGYPTYSGNGIAVRTLFNPDIARGNVVQVVTDLTPAAGKWSVTSTAHTLESETPNGAWFTDIRCNRNLVND